MPASAACAQSAAIACTRPRTELYLDGLHPNEKGHEVMAERVAKVIAAIEREQMNA